jgi:hypothetical protein
MYSQLLGVSKTWSKGDGQERKTGKGLEEEKGKANQHMYEMVAKTAFKKWWLCQFRNKVMFLSCRTYTEFFFIFSEFGRIEKIDFKNSDLNFFDGLQPLPLQPLFGLEIAQDLLHDVRRFRPRALDLFAVEAAEVLVVVAVVELVELVVEQGQLKKYNLNVTSQSNDCWLTKVLINVTRKLEAK